MRNSILAALPLLVAGPFLGAQPSPADLEERIADLEARLKQVTKELQEVRSQVKAAVPKGDALIIRLIRP